MVKYLIIRFSSIGDIVLTTPVVRNLKQQAEEAEIHYLTKKQFAPVLEANPYITKIHALDNNMPALLRELKAEKFDYIIDLHRNLRSLRVKQALRRYSFSFDKLNIKKWLLVNLRINRMPDTHIVDRYMETIRLFIEEEDTQGLDYFISDSEAVDPVSLDPALKEKFLAVVVGGGHYTKQIPAEELSKLIQKISAPVVLLGGPADKHKAAEIADKLGGKGKVVDFTGKLSVGESASVVKQCAAILTPDTGLMHIAAAFGKQIFSVWGNTVPAFGMYPYRPGAGSEIFQVEGLKCRPCSKIGHPACPKGHFKCMRQQDFRNLSRKINFVFNP